MIINKYRVMLFENGKNTFTKADSTIASSSEEAINKVRNNKFWYDEGVGYNHNKLKYPLTFKAVISND